jgi:phosphoribosyl 1,2-cyclic phosphate phosphodiesterase
VSVELTILGSGTSHGIPMIACDCPVCTSSDPRDKRTRASALFSFDDCSLLIDTPPELRLQCLACDVRRIDAILLTHAHADHITGLDDVRIFNALQQEALDVYGNAPALERLQAMFRYAFDVDCDYPSAVPSLRAVVVEGTIDAFARPVIPIPYAHGPVAVFGYRVGKIAYCPDCNGIPDSSRPLLEDLDVLVLDALRRRPHPTHFNLDQAIAEAHRIGARQTVFTHIAHELGHAATEAALPAGMIMAYDGMVLTSDA